MPRRGRHRRRRLHRQPHGRPAARARLSRCASSTIWSAGASRTSRITRPTAISAWTGSDIRALQPIVADLRASATSSTSPASATSCRRSKRPSEYMSSTCRARCACSKRARTPCPQKFVYAASSSCYGLAATPTREDHPIDPQYPYALSKYQGEQAVFHWHQVYRLPVNSIRIFNAYGTRVRTTGAYGAVFGVFLKQKLAGKPFTVVGDGTQTPRLPLRDRCRRGVSRGRRDRHAGEVFNLGAGNPQIGQSAGRTARRRRRLRSQTPGRAGLHLGRHHQDHAATSAGSRRSPSRKAWRACWPISSTGAMPRCGTRTRSRRRRETWFQYLGDKPKPDRNT